MPRKHPRKVFPAAQVREFREMYGIDLDAAATCRNEDCSQWQLEQCAPLANDPLLPGVDLCARVETNEGSMGRGIPAPKGPEIHNRLVLRACATQPEEIRYTYRVKPRSQRANPEDLPGGILGNISIFAKSRAEADAQIQTEYPEHFSDIDLIERSPIYPEGGSQREGFVSCVHTVVDASPLALGAALGARGRAVELLPEQHFVALWSYASGLAEHGLERSLREAGTNEDVLRLNPGMVSQLYGAIAAVAPAAAREFARREIFETAERAGRDPAFRDWAFLWRDELYEKWRAMLHTELCNDVDVWRAAWSATHNSTLAGACAATSKNPAVLADLVALWQKFRSTLLRENLLENAALPPDARETLTLQLPLADLQAPGAPVVFQQLIEEEYGHARSALPYEVHVLGPWTSVFDATREARALLPPGEWVAASARGAAPPFHTEVIFYQPRPPHVARGTAPAALGEAWVVSGWDLKVRDALPLLPDAGPWVVLYDEESGGARHLSFVRQPPPATPDLAPVDAAFVPNPHGLAYYRVTAGALAGRALQGASGSTHDAPAGAIAVARQHQPGHALPLSILRVPVWLWKGARDPSHRLVPPAPGEEGEYTQKDVYLAAFDPAENPYLRPISSVEGEEREEDEEE